MVFLELCDTVSPRIGAVTLKKLAVKTTTDSSPFESTTKAIKSGGCDRECARGKVGK